MLLPVRDRRDAVSTVSGSLNAVLPQQPMQRIYQGFRARAALETGGAAPPSPPKETPRFGRQQNGGYIEAVRGLGVAQATSSGA